LRATGVEAYGKKITKRLLTRRKTDQRIVGHQKGWFKSKVVKAGQKSGYSEFPKKKKL